MSDIYHYELKPISKDVKWVTKTFLFIASHWTLNAKKTFFWNEGSKFYTL